jgi:hypothetical protein
MTVSKAGGCAAEVDVSRFRPLILPVNLSPPAERSDRLFVSLI